MATDFRELYKGLPDEQLARIVKIVQGVLDGALNAAVDKGLRVTPPTWEVANTGDTPLVLKTAVLARDVMAAPLVPK